MKALYDSTTNSLKDQPVMNKPVRARYDWISKYKEDLEAYDSHIASLRTIPCDESCRGVFIHGCEYEEGKDYEVKGSATWTYHPTYGYGCAECCNGDRCDEDCTAKYRRPNCPYCKGKGWFKEKPFFAYPIGKDVLTVPLSPPVQEDELWDEVLLKLHIAAREYHADHPGLPNHRPWHEAIVAELTKHFILTKR
jgi:hypothetical protein